MNLQDLSAKPHPTQLSLPSVILLGRPNTGKSTLFNTLMGRRINIVESTPGTTRDQIASLFVVKDGSCACQLIDMPGFENSTLLSQKVHSRSHPNADLVPDLGSLYSATQEKLSQAIWKANVILYLLAKEGPHPTDLELFRKLRKMQTPTIFVINKIDQPLKEEAVALAEYAPHHLSHLLAISCKARWHLGELRNRIASVVNMQQKEYSKLDESSQFTDAPEKEKRVGQQVWHVKKKRLPNNPALQMDQPVLQTENLASQIILIGKPNSGKSSLFNFLLGADLALTDAARETTRDPLEGSLTYSDHLVSLLDTAGLRKISKMQRISFYAAIRTLRALENANMVWFLIPVDEETKVSKIDRRIFNFIWKARKPMIFLHTKSDLLPTYQQQRDFLHQFSYIFPEYKNFLRYFISTQKRNGGFPAEIWHKSFEMIRHYQKNIPIKTLQDWLRHWKRKQEQTVGPGSALMKIRFLRQLYDAQPVFLCFTHSSDHLTVHLRGQLEKALQQDFYSPGVSVQVFYRKN